MLDLAYLTDLFEMIAKLGVTFILHKQTRTMRAEMREIRTEMLAMRDAAIAAKPHQED